MAYGILLKLNDKQALIVGGGTVALGKARRLLHEGARVRVVSPFFHPEFQGMSWDEKNSLELLQDEFRELYLEGVDLVFAATSSEEVNQQIRRACRKRHLWCNNTSDSVYSDFQNMAQTEKAGVQFFASTQGGAPGLSSKLLRDLVETLDENALEELQRYAEFRRKIRGECADAEMRKYWLETLMNTPASQLDQWFDDYRKGEGYDRQSRK